MDSLLAFCKLMPESILVRSTFYNLSSKCWARLRQRPFIGVQMMEFTFTACFSKMRCGILKSDVWLSHCLENSTHKSPSCTSFPSISHITMLQKILDLQTRMLYDLKRVLLRTVSKLRSTSVPFIRLRQERVFSRQQANRPILFWR